MVYHKRFANCPPTSSHRQSTYLEKGKGKGVYIDVEGVPLKECHLKFQNKYTCIERFKKPCTKLFSENCVRYDCVGFGMNDQFHLTIAWNKETDKSSNWIEWNRKCSSSLWIFKYVVWKEKLKRFIIMPLIKRPISILMKSSSVYWTTNSFIHK